MSEPPQEADRLIYAGLLGLSVAALIQLSDKNTSELDVWLLISLYCYAAAIPFLAVGIVNDFARRMGHVVSRLRDAFGVVGCLLAILALGLLFTHYGVWIGATFAGAMMLAFLIVRYG
jgi:hypothetical protein